MGGREAHLSDVPQIAGVLMILGGVLPPRDCESAEAAVRQSGVCRVCGVVSGVYGLQREGEST